MMILLCVICVNICLGAGLISLCLDGIEERLKDINSTLVGLTALYSSVNGHPKGKISFTYDEDRTTTSSWDGGNK